MADVHSKKQRLIEITEAVAVSLDRLDRVAAERRRGMADLIGQLLEATVRLVAEANQEIGQESDAAGRTGAELIHAFGLQAPAFEDVDDERDHLEVAEIQTDDEEGSKVKLMEVAELSLARAYRNAVRFQHQDEVIARAALTQGIATLLAIVTASVSELEADHLAEQGSAAGSSPRLVEPAAGY